MNNNGGGMVGWGLAAGLLIIGDVHGKINEYYKIIQKHICVVFFWKLNLIYT